MCLSCGHCRTLTNLQDLAEVMQFQPAEDGGILENQGEKAARDLLWCPCELVAVAGTPFGNHCLSVLEALARFKEVKGLIGMPL